jgi:YVTN family beta-propeller protein
MKIRLKHSKADALAFYIACSMSVCFIPSVQAANQQDPGHRSPPLPEIISTILPGSGPAQPSGCRLFIDCVSNGSFPWGFAVNKKTNRIYVPVRGDSAVAVIDGDTDKQVATLTGDIAVFVDPSPPTIDEEHNKLYMNYLALDGSAIGVSEIDGKTNTITRTSIFSPSDMGGIDGVPVEIYLNQKMHKIYVPFFYGSQNGIVVVDQRSLKVIKTILMEAYMIAINEKTNKLYVSAEAEGDGKITVIDGKTDLIAKVIQAGRPAEPDECYHHGNCTTFGSALRNLSVNDKTNKIYVAAYEDGVIEIDGRTDSVSRVIPVGIGAVDTSVNSETNIVYVPNSLDSSVSVIDGSTGKVAGRVAVGHPALPAGCNTEIGSPPCNIDQGSLTVTADVNERTGKVYAVNAADGDVAVLGTRRTGDHHHYEDDIDQAHHDSHAVNWSMGTRRIEHR